MGLFLAFGLTAAALTWSIGAFDGTVSTEIGDTSSSEILAHMFPLLFNASFLSAPLVGWWAERIGMVGPSFAQVIVCQGLLACFIWPSEVSLSIAIACANAANSCVYAFQAGYLLTFPKSEFTALLSGTILVQALAMLFVDFGPKQGQLGATAWLFGLMVAYIWPVLHMWHSYKDKSRNGATTATTLLCQHVQTCPSSTASDAPSAERLPIS